MTEQYKRVWIIAFAVMLVGMLGAPSDAQSGRQVWVYFFGWYTDASWNDPRLINHPQV